MPERPPVPFDAIPSLSLLTRDERSNLAPLCELTAYEKGATIFSEGDPAERIHFLFLGRVKIVKAGPERNLILEILGPGEPVGAVAAFERRPFPASAVALEPCGLVSIPERAFFQLIEKHPEITRRLLAGLTLRLMALNRRLADMTGNGRVPRRPALRNPRRAAGQGRRRRRLRPAAALAAGDRRPRRNHRRNGNPHHEPLAEGGSGGNGPEGFLIRDPSALRRIAPE